MVIESISLQDLLAEQASDNLGEYLSLSVKRGGGDTKISFTTTGADPVTYSAVISAFNDQDLQSLVFVSSLKPQ